MPATAALLGTTTAEARRTMGRLLDAHLVEQTRPGHYQQHDLLRAYARDLANAEVVEAEAALDRWCRWLVHTVANGRRATAGGLPWYDFGEPGDVVPVEFGDAEQAMSWFEAERLNAAAAAADAAGRGWSRTVCHIAHLFWPYLFYRHDLDQIFELQRLALEAASVTGDLSVAATAETQLGATCLRAGDFEYAIEHAQAAVRHWEQTDSVIGLVTALGHLGFILQKSGRYEAALSRQREGLRLAAEPRDRMHALKYLAVTLVSMGRCEEAIAVCEEARPLLDLPGGSYLKPHVLDTHGQALAGTGSFEAAIDAYREAVAIFRVWAAPWSTALVLSHRGAAEEAIGRTDDARASYAEALALLDEIGAVDNEELSPADVRRRLASLSEVTPATG